MQRKQWSEEGTAFPFFACLSPLCPTFE
jgi:hypothetical protein